MAAPSSPETTAIERAWLCRGLRLPWRVTAGDFDYGEWRNLADAQQFLALLRLGNPGLKGASDGTE